MTGARAASPRLTQEQIIEIEIGYAVGKHYSVVAKELGVTATCVWTRYGNIRRGYSSVPKDSKPTAAEKKPRLYPAVTDPSLLKKMVGGRA